MHALRARVLGPYRPSSSVRPPASLDRYQRQSLLGGTLGLPLHRPPVPLDFCPKPTNPDPQRPIPIVVPWVSHFAPCITGLLPEGRALPWARSSPATHWSGDAPTRWGGDPHVTSPHGSTHPPRRPRLSGFLIGASVLGLLGTVTGTSYHHPPYRARECPELPSGHHERRRRWPRAGPQKTAFSRVVHRILSGCHCDEGLNGGKKKKERTRLRSRGRLT